METSLCPSVATPLTASSFPSSFSDQDSGQGRGAPSHQDGGQGKAAPVSVWQHPDQGGVGLKDDVH